MKQLAIDATLIYYSTGVYGKPSGINDPDLDKLIDAQAVEFACAKRGAIFQQIERLMLDKVYKAPISTPTLIRVSQPWIHDWVDNRGAHPSIVNPEAVWMSEGDRTAEPSLAAISRVPDIPAPRSESGRQKAGSAWQVST